MLFAQKVQTFGEQVVKDYTKIMSLISSSTPVEVKKFITSIKDYKRRILTADTYFSIIKGAETNAV